MMNQNVKDLTKYFIESIDARIFSLKDLPASNEVLDTYMVAHQEVLSARISINEILERIRIYITQQIGRLLHEGYTTQYGQIEEGQIGFVRASTIIKGPTPEEDTEKNYTISLNEGMSQQLITDAETENPDTTPDTSGTTDNTVEEQSEPVDNSTDPTAEAQGDQNRETEKEG